MKLGKETATLLSDHTRLGYILNVDRLKVAAVDLVVVFCEALI